MKQTLLLFLTVFLGQAVGGLYEANVNTYDSDSGLYYLAIWEKAESQGLFSKTNENRIININIFDPKTENSSLLLKSPIKDGIDFILFESSVKDGSIIFSGYSSRVLNNTMVATRSPRDKILFGIRSKETVTLFTATKRGEEVKSLVTIPTNASWHIDARNSKLRIAQQINGALKIDSYDW